MTDFYFVDIGLVQTSRSRGIDLENLQAYILQSIGCQQLMFMEHDAPKS